MLCVNLSSLCTRKQQKVSEERTSIPCPLLNRLFKMKVATENGFETMKSLLLCFNLIGPNVLNRCILNIIFPFTITIHNIYNTFRSIIQKNTDITKHFKPPPKLPMTNSCNETLTDHNSLLKIDESDWMYSNRTDIWKVAFHQRRCVRGRLKTTARLSKGSFWPETVPERILTSGFVVTINIYFDTSEIRLCNILRKAKV